MHILLFRYFGKILRIKEVVFTVVERRNSFGKKCHETRAVDNLSLRRSSRQTESSSSSTVVCDAKLLFAYRENNWTIFGRYIAKDLISPSLSLSLSLSSEIRAYLKKLSWRLQSS